MPELLSIEEVVYALEAGKVVAIPTESSFGLMARIDSPKALKELLTLKPQRKKPIPLVIGDPKILPVYVREVPPWAALLQERFWPGPLTLVYWARPEVPAEIHQGTETVGIRQPGVSHLLQLLKLVGVPLTATSANPPGDPPLTTAAEVIRTFPDLFVWVVLREAPGGPPSTILDIRTPEVKVLRAGRIPAEEIGEALSQSENRLIPHAS